MPVRPQIGKMGPTIGRYVVLRAVIMSIERLQLAATAAGYAMAAVEDDSSDDVVTGNPVARPLTGTALMLAPPVPRPNAGPRDAMASGSAWLRSFLPAFGGGATA